MSAAAAIANRLLDRDGWSRRALLPHTGKVVRIRFGPTSADFRIAGDGRLIAVAAVVPDTVLAIPLRSALAALDDPDRAAGAIAVEGDAEFGAALVAISRIAPWLAESALARVVGPIAARRLADTARSALRLPRYAAGRLGENLRGYAASEMTWTVRRGEFDRFAEDIAALDSRVEAAFARVQSRDR